MLQAAYPGRTNGEAADELASLLKQAYQSPLYEVDEPFKGAIVYEEKGVFVFKD